MSEDTKTEEPEVVKNPIIQQMSVDAQILIATLKDIAVGEVATYQSLSATIKRNVQTDAYGAMTTARRALQRDHRMIFGTVRGVGLRRLNDGEIVDAGRSHITSMRRTSRRGLKKLACVDWDNLDNASRIKHNASASMLGAVNMITRESSIKKLEAKIEKTKEKLPIASTLALFSGKED